MARKLSWCVISIVCLIGFLTISLADDLVEIDEENIAKGRQLIRDLYNNYTTSAQPRTNPVDLVFVLDRSASVTRAGWQSMVRFVHNFLEHFTVDAENSRVAVITYGTTASIDIDGVRAGNYNKCALVTRLQKHLAMKIPSGYSATHDAIMKVKDVVVDSRKEAKKAVIVITDGKSNIGPSPVRASVQLRSLVWDPDWDASTKGPQLQIYAFGIKDAHMPEVKTIASPLKNHTFYIPSFQTFSELARSLHNDSQSENWQVLGDKGYCRPAYDCSENAYCACGTRSGLYVCVCKDGYQGDGHSCTACPRGTYKNTISPMRCQPCPANSTTLSEGATDALQCVCESPLYQEASGRPCHVKYCEQLPEISHGKKFHVAGRVVDEVSDTGVPCTNTPDTSCHYHCHEGYRLNGHPGLVCNPNGTWDGTVPECQIVDCSTLEFHHQEIQNGDVEYLNGTTTYGSWLRVRCREGYRTFGDPERNCTQHGDWSGTRTWCVENKCRALPLTPGLIITPVVCGQSALLPGSLCTFLCERGYELSGPTNVTCSDQGAWNGASETLCTDIEPPAITCPDDLTTHMTRANFAEVHLPAGGARVSDNSNRFTVEAVGVGDGAVNLTAGVHQIKYVARDRAGNEAQCFQTITVVETVIHVVTCPNETIHVEMTQHMSEVAWPEVAFADHNNATVGHSCVPANNSLLPPGHYEVQCTPAVQTIVKVTCQFKVVMLLPKCTMPAAPLHGSLTCSPTPTSLLTCHVKCNDKYDFHHLPQTHYICDLRGVWNLKTHHFWPDCTRKYYPDRALLKGQAQYFYFRGKCEDTKTQIADTFRNYLQIQSWKVCGQELCSVEDVKVVCGESSRLKTRETRADALAAIYRGPSRKRRTADGEIPAHGKRETEFRNGSQEVLRKLFLMSGNELAEGVENEDPKSTTVPAKSETTSELFRRGETPGEGEETSTKIYALSKRQVGPEEPEVPEYIDDSFDDQYDADVDWLLNQTASGLLDGYNSTVSDANPDSVSWIQNNEKNKVKITFEVIKKTPPGQEVNSMVQSELIQHLYEISDALAVVLRHFNLSVPDNSNSSGGPSYDNATTTTSGNGTSGGLLVASQTSFEDPVIPRCSEGHVGQTEEGSTLKCTACPRGTYHDQEQDVCQPCPYHEYQPDEGQLHCISCPEGTSTERTGSDNVSLCAADCSEGEYSMSGFAPCIPCPLHMYNPVTASKTCFPCPLNKKTLRLGTKTSTECIDPCSPGMFSDTGLVPCLPCPRGSYNAEHGATSCYPCEQGRSTPETGSVDNDSCEGWDPCRDNNTECLNNGTCRVNGNLAFCECAPGFAGAACDYNVDDCADQICFDGATCVDGVNNFTCVCAPGHTGKYCEVNIDECLSSPCQNGGSCLDKVNDYECYCPHGYTGRRCEVQATPCASGRCVHGACVNSTNGEARCTCHTGYSGPSCNVAYDLCSTHPCLHASQCVSAPGNYTCICLPGYRGVNCDAAIDHCTSSPCHEGSTCISLTTGFLCKCPGNWTETLCDTESIPDADLLFNPDSVYGHYVSLPREFMPALPAFTLSAWLRPLPLASFATIVAASVLPPQQASDDDGGDLETVFAVRHTDKLIITIFEESFTANASLSPYVWTHLCVAWSSVTGQWSVLVNGSVVSSGNVQGPLKAIPANAFLVIGQQNPYYAEADQSWDVYTGEITQFNIFGRVLSRDDIASLANQSACNQTLGDVVSWTEVLYHARDGATIREYSQCLDINECFFPGVFPCPVNRVCHDGLGWYNCSDCVEGYTGPDCTEPDDECYLGDKCYSGTCVDDGPELFDFRCICSPGYTGVTCSARIDECLSNPCQNGGTCNLTLTTFTCLCPEPNMGPLCERPSSPCLPNPCQNNGTCSEAVSSGGYACACREHFTGRNCERQLGWCEENVCLNGATCEGGSTTNAGHCLCWEGWTGKLCGVRVAPSCDLSPCVDGGTCVPAPDTTDGYVCRCRGRPGGVALDKNCAAPSPCEASPCPSTHVCVSRGASHSCECLKPGCQPWTGGNQVNSTAEPTPYNNMKKLKDYWWSSDWAFAMIAGTAVLLVAILVVTVYMCRKKKSASADLEVLNSSPAVALGHMTNPGFQNDEGLDQESTYAELSDEYSAPDRDNVYEDQAATPSSHTTSPGTRKVPASRTSSGSSSSGSFSSIRPYLSEKLRKSNETTAPLLSDDYLEPLAVKNEGNAQGTALPPHCAVRNLKAAGGDGLLNAGFNPDDYLIPEVDRLAKSAQVLDDKQRGAATQKKKADDDDVPSVAVYVNSHSGLSDFVLEDYILMGTEKRGGPQNGVKSSTTGTDKQKNIYTNLKSSPSTNPPQISSTEVNVGHCDGPTPHGSKTDGGQKPLPVDTYFISSNQDDTNGENSVQKQTQEKVTRVGPAVGLSEPFMQNYVPFLDVLEQDTQTSEGHKVSETLSPSQIHSSLNHGVTGHSLVPTSRENVPTAYPELVCIITNPTMLSCQPKTGESGHKHDAFVLEDFTSKLDSSSANALKKKVATAMDKPVLKDFSAKKSRPKKGNPLFLASNSSSKFGGAVGSGISSKPKHGRQAAAMRESGQTSVNNSGTKGSNQAIQKRRLPPLPSEDVLEEQKMN